MDATITHAHLGPDHEVRDAVVRQVLDSQGANLHYDQHLHDVLLTALGFVSPKM